MINLLPDSASGLNNHRPEPVDIAMLDMATTQLLNLYMAIDNGTDANCVMSWVRQYISSGKEIPPTEARDVFMKIYKELANAHSQITAARRERD